MKPLRIALFTPTFLPKCAGAEIFHHNLATSLAASGHKPVAVMPRRNIREIRKRGWDLPYEIEGYPANFWSHFKRSIPLAFWLNRRALSGLQRKHRFDAWHAVVLFPAGVCLIDWQERSGIPGLVRAVGDDVRGLPGRGHEPRVEAILRGKMPQAQMVVALSDSMVDDLGALGVDKSRTRILPNAVDGKRFAAGSTREALRESLGISPDAFVFLCVARNHPQKNHPMLFRAFRRLVEAHPDRVFHLLVAGRGASMLRTEAEAAGLAGEVGFYEFGAPADGSEVPLMPPQGLVDLYRAADAFVLASLLEGFSSALLEAMAAGLPIVATDVSGIREVVRSGENGLLVPGGDETALARDMGEVSRSADLRARLAAGALATAEHYTWASVTSAYIALYRELIETRGRHGP